MYKKREFLFFSSFNQESWNSNKRKLVTIQSEQKRTHDLDFVHVTFPAFLQRLLRVAIGLFTMDAVSMSLRDKILVSE